MDPPNPRKIVHLALQRPLGALLCLLEAFLGLLGRFLGTSMRCLAPSCGLLAPSWGTLMPSWRSYPFSGPSWCFLSAPWAPLGTSCPSPGALLNLLGAYCHLLGAFLCSLGPPWASLKASAPQKNIMFNCDSHMNLAIHVSHLCMSLVSSDTSLIQLLPSIQASMPPRTDSRGRRQRRSLKIIIRAHLCWNFGRLVPGTLGSHRYQTKTHGSHHLGAQFGHKISSN